MKIKYQLPLTHADRVKLSQLVTDVRTAFAEDDASAKERQKALDLADRLVKKVEELSVRFKSGDLDCLAELTTSKAQLATLGAKVKTDATPPKRGLADRYYGTMIHAHDLIRPFLSVALQDARAEIASALRPYFPDEAQARDIANQAPAPNAFSAWMGLHLRMSDPKAALSRSVETAENLLSGNDLWSSDSRITR